MDFNYNYYDIIDTFQPVWADRDHVLMLSTFFWIKFVALVIGNFPPLTRGKYVTRSTLDKKKCIFIMLTMSTLSVLYEARESPLKCTFRLPRRCSRCLVSSVSASRHFDLLFTHGHEHTAGSDGTRTVPCALFVLVSR